MSTTRSRDTDVPLRTTSKASPWASFDGAALLIILPFFNMSMTAATYTFLPLHFLDTDGFTLSMLGLIFLFGNGSRLMSATLITRAGDWCILLFLVPLAITHVWLLSSEVTSPIPTFITFVMLYASNAILSLQGLVHITYSKGDGEKSELKRALRIFTVSETLGYATATLMGGFLYDYGGFTLCIYTQFGIVIGQIVVLLCLPVVHKSMANSCGRCLCCNSGAVSSIDGDGNVEDESKDKNAIKIDDENNLHNDDDSVMVDGVRFTSDEIYASIRPFVWIVLTFHFWNLFTYATEWALFAVFFRQQYNWSSTWTGAGQMSGDILAAGVLLASVAACKQNSSKAKVAKETECVSEEYALKKLDKTQDIGGRGGDVP